MRLLVTGFLVLSTVFAAFPSSEENIKLADQAVKELRDLIEGNRHELWPNLERHGEGWKIYAKESIFPELKEHLLMAEIIVKANTTKISTLLAPFRGYRSKWDDLYEFNRVVDRLDNNSYVIHEAVHRVFILSARDAVIACKEEVIEEKIIMACRNTTHVNVPENDDYVRTVQRLVGYYLQPYEKNPQWTKANVLIGLDLNLPVTFFSSLAERFKPGQMVDFIGRLNNAAEEYNI
ncbi:unnamed protein product [Bursaphelenchus xylophilus]|uniref:(pine wood nematode) hypothetical protein n=1 Tax=Bursaphelenchus xylophilus TaxID=6326 RepID=A0A1I7RNL4_BURXY|nr:unnamed protein product [Bursaphelenchus xylophilus]CAG9124140.1 unnamed protein product [Bursaphelenchus xylophilus]